MLVLHVCPSASEPWVLDAIRDDALGDLRVQSIPRADLAAARIAGGGVGAVLLNLSGCGDPPDLSALKALRSYALETPILIAASRDSVQVERNESVVTPGDATRLPALLRKAIDHGIAESLAETRPESTTKIIGFLGVKGGVGTTTTALNIAAALAQTRTVALAELRPDLSGLLGRIKNATRQTTLEALLERPAEEVNASAVEELLWTPEYVPNLRVLAAPTVSRRSLTMSGDHVKKIIRHLIGYAQIVVLDLALGLREALRAAGTDLDQLVLVAERTPFCLALAREISAELFSWEISRNAMSCLIVNRSPVGVPPPIRELESQLEIAVLGVLPPDADVCVKAESLRRPIVTIQPEGLIAQSLDAIIQRLEARLTMGRV